MGGEVITIDLDCTTGKLLTTSILPDAKSYDAAEVPSIGKRWCGGCQLVQHLASLPVSMTVNVSANRI
jgi:hypothetical protein